MQPSLGAKIGEGATAEVYAFAPGQVVKLFKAGIPGRIGRHEAAMTRASFAAGGVAPEVFDEVTLEGRYGLVLARLEGPSLMQAVKSGALSNTDAGAVLAEQLRAVHAAAPPPAIPALRETLAVYLRRAPGVLPAPVAAGLSVLLDHLPPDEGFCHGDPNPGNVILTAEGPRLIDWIGAMRAPAAFDLAAAQVILTELAPHLADDPARPRAIHAALSAAYAALAGTSEAALAASAATYQPLVRALMVFNGAVPAMRARLAERLEDDFGG